MVPKSYNDVLKIEDNLRAQARNYFKDLTHSIEEIFFYFMYDHLEIKSEEIKERILRSDFISSFVALHQAYESCLRKYFGTALTLIRSVFESLLHNFYLLIAEKEKVEVYLKHLGGIELQPPELKIFKGCQKFSPIYFREYFYKQGTMLPSINRYYKGMSEIVHNPWTGIQSILDAEFDDLKGLLNEVVNLQIWHILVLYETIRDRLKKSRSKEIGDLLLRISKLVPGILDLKPIGFRTLQEIISEMLENDNA